MKHNTAVVQSFAQPGQFTIKFMLAAFNPGEVTSNVICPFTPMVLTMASSLPLNSCLLDALKGDSPTGLPLSVADNFPAP
jgi:hypothetical protein